MVVEVVDPDLAALRDAVLRDASVVGRKESSAAVATDDRVLLRRVNLVNHRPPGHRVGVGRGQLVPDDVVPRSGRLVVAVGVSADFFESDVPAFVRVSLDVERSLLFRLIC